MLASLLRRQWLLGLRRPVQVLNPLLFFALVITLFPLGLGPSPEVLARFAAGILWIVALLSNMLGVDGLFRDDFEDGSLDQLLLAEAPLYLLVLPYLLVHWLLSGVTLALASPLFALMLGLPTAGIPVLVGALLLGSGVMSVLGSVAAALTLGLRRGGMLIALLVAPLYVPVLIFGAAAVQAALDGLAWGSYLALLGALLCAALALGPLAVAAGLRISADV